ncbi:MAG: class I SAM-dependent methyltransferase [Kofleriaceae bacterium]
MLSLLDRIKYTGQHWSFLLNATLMQEAARFVTRTPRVTVPPAQMKTILSRRKQLHARDLENVNAGLYPRELLFDMPVRQFLRSFPKLVADTPRVVRRMRSKNFRDIPVVDKERFPAYYRRNFHWQTDGYFSERSAEVYELGVEMLFAGTADVMRRQIVPPITRFVREHGPANRVRLLDVGCGTGRTLHQIARTHPTMRLWGVDLSPAYVRVARKRLHHIAELTLAVENGERLPFADGAFDIATSVYLFHELPPNARRNVVRELFRVVRPGGLVVIEDSAQLAESAEIGTALREFPREFHEPFYAGYLEDDLAPIFAQAGFTVESVEPHLVAKVVVVRRP